MLFKKGILIVVKNSFFKTKLILCKHVYLPDSLYKDRLAVAVFDKKNIAFIQSTPAM